MQAAVRQTAPLVQRTVHRWLAAVSSCLQSRRAGLAVRRAVLPGAPRRSRRKIARLADFVRRKWDQII